MGAMTDLFSAISRLKVSGLVRILSVSAYYERNTEETKERERQKEDDRTVFSLKQMMGEIKDNSDT